MTTLTKIFKFIGRLAGALLTGLVAAIGWSIGKWVWRIGLLAALGAGASAFLK